MRKGLAALALLFLLVSVPAAEPTFGVGDGARRPEVERVLILSVPHVAWSDLGRGDTPHLDALLDDSAIGNLAVRGVRRRTTTGEGYATLGAGTRAGAPKEVDGIALAPDEEFEGGPAADAYHRRTGEPLGPAAAGNLSIAGYHKEQDRLLFGGEVGALGDALTGAGVGTAVIGNADLARTGTDPIRYGRQAVSALMDSDGRLAGGRVDRGLLRPEPDAAFGLRLDPAAVAEAFAAVWRDRSVVLVEGSDLVRSEAYAAFARSGPRAAMHRAALRQTDGVIGALMARVDRSHDAVVVVGPSSPQAVARLTLAGLAVPGQEAGLVRSASTRRSGFVTLADVAPTVLDLLSVPRPSSMEGRPMEWGRRGGDAEARRHFLIGADADARFRDSLVTPVASVFVVAQVLLSGLAVLALRRGRGRGRTRALVEVGALALLASLPLTYLSALFPLVDYGTGAYFAFVVGGAVLVGLGGWALGQRRGGPRRPGGTQRRDLLPLGAVLALMSVVIVGSAVTGSSLQLSTVFGDSPIVAGRFSGINNLTFAQIITAALLLAAFLAHRLPGRRGVLVGLSVVAGALVVVGLPAWGADIGGVLSAVPAFVVVASLFFGMRVGLRTALIGAGVTAAAIGAFTLFDLSRPSSRRSHLGRLFEQVDTDGWEAAILVVERKLDANLSVLTKSPWTLMVPAALAFVAYLVYRSPSSLGEIQRRLPELRVALAGILVAGLLGFALNDSGIAVPGMILGVLNPALVYLSARWT